MDRDYGPRFSLDELVEATGVPRRTVRFYIGEGLVPPAAGKGRYSYYTSDHVEALARIKELRDRSLSLDEVRVAIEEEQSATVSPLIQGESWKRIALHPDLEIHIRDGAAESIQALVHQIEEQTALWLGRDTGLG